MAQAVAAGVLGDLIEETMFRYIAPELDAKRCAKVEVTRTCDNFYHAMAVARHLRNTPEYQKQHPQWRTREHLRLVATAWIEHRFEDPKLKKMAPHYYDVPTNEKRARNTMFMAGTAKGVIPGFVHQLHKERQWKEGLNTPSNFETPFEYGMPRALEAMQDWRRKCGKPDVRWVDDYSKYYPEQGPEYKRPKDWVYGHRMVDYVDTYVGCQRQKRTWATLYDVEALAWNLPERIPIALHYQHKDTGKVMTLMLGPPRNDVVPYALQWSGDDSMRFWPIIQPHEMAQRAAIEEFAKTGTPPAYKMTDWIGKDYFAKHNVTRQKLIAARSALQQKQRMDAGVARFANDDTVADPQELSEWLGVTPEQLEQLEKQAAAEDYGYYDLNTLRKEQEEKRDKMQEKRKFGAVTISMRVDNPNDWSMRQWETPIAKNKKQKHYHRINPNFRRHTTRHDPAKDKWEVWPSEPWVTCNMTEREMLEEYEEIKHDLNRMPVPREMLARYPALGTVSAAAHALDRLAMARDRTLEVPYNEDWDFVSDDEHEERMARKRRRLDEGSSSSVEPMATESEGVGEEEEGEEEEEEEFEGSM